MSTADPAPLHTPTPSENPPRQNRDPENRPRNPNADQDANPRLDRRADNSRKKRQSRPHPPNRGPGRPNDVADASGSRSQSHTRNPDSRPSRRPRNFPRRNDGEPPAGFTGADSGGNNDAASRASGSRSQSRNRNPDSKPPRLPRNPPRRNDGESSARGGRQPSRGNGRASRFKGKLSEPAQAPGAVPDDTKPAEKYQAAAPHHDDLTSRLIYELRTPPYPDCPICFNPVHPAQPTWSCSPTIVHNLDESDSEKDGAKENANAQCCWTTFHLKCIRSWAAKSVKDIEDAWRARGEERKGDWRCPGCQSKRDVVPRGYWCFCGAQQEPKPPRLATPHSCSNPCSRPRACGHACPLACHPGPCPPCQITTHQPCYCGKTTISFRCSHSTANPIRNRGVPLVDLSCGHKCEKKLSCGNHICESICHEGPCEPCKVREVAKCWCGKVEKEVSCGFGDPRPCAVLEDGHEETWLGKFDCGNLCDRPFDCGIHRCERPCHPPSLNAPPCPRSPSVITHCPCGKHPLTPDSTSFFPPGTKLTRTACTDPIPTCTSLCKKPLANCSHVCSSPCHLGPCPPCTIPLVRPCRCGATTREVPCYEAGAHEEILCDRPCGALRACGRHQCTRLCCPLAALANSGKGKGKRRAVKEAEVVDEAGWHECDLVCGKMLGCGNHRCEERDHRGPCPPCLRSSFEELVCHCGRTVLEPPIACGTRINCTYPCSRPPPPCGHPKTQHTCHEDPSPCPPCPFLTSKMCACGKKSVDNVRCSQERVSCGAPCGKLLRCGFHHCERPCHGDPCGPCAAVCGKPRKLCLPSLHPCPHPCHAPASCPEAEPCRTIVTITCPCGRLRQAVECGRCTGSPAGREATQKLKCSNECAIAKRNAKLAEALGIDTGGRGGEKPVVYSDELVAMARTNAKFVALVEKTFAEFVTSDKKVQVLPHMPEARRKFVHDLAAVYRMDTEMVDQEPHRSVQLVRRLDTRIPNPLLSASVSLGSSSSLGKLADLRAKPYRAPAPVAPAPAAQTTHRGWTSVVSTSRPASGSSTPPAQGPPAPAWTTPSAALRAPPVPRPTPSPRPAPPVQQAGDNVPDDWEDDL
ncbi:hypothetical protein DENSPDRAFT_822377 [Dentipellis sp. KUC8613]|nr:hypothetical protein DENSPDRAFT_822377 [Dentipellis sp. KUC8613]